MNNTLSFEDCRKGNTELLQELFLTDPRTGEKFVITEYINAEKPGDDQGFIITNESLDSKYKILYKIEEIQ